MIDDYNPSSSTKSLDSLDLNSRIIIRNKRLTRHGVESMGKSRIERAKLHLVFQEILAQVEDLSPAVTKSQAESIDRLAPDKGYYLSFEVQRRDLGNEVRIEEILDISKKEAKTIRDKKGYITSQAAAIGVCKSRLIRYLRGRDLASLNPREFSRFSGLLDAVDNQTLNVLMLKFERDDRKKDFEKQREKLSVPVSNKIVIATGLERAMEAVNALKAREREILILKKKKSRDIGELLNLANTRVQYLYVSAKRKLKKGLDQYLYTPLELDDAIRLQMDADEFSMEKLQESQRKLNEKMQEFCRIEKEKKQAHLDKLIAERAELFAWITAEHERCLAAQTLLTKLKESENSADPGMWATIETYFRLGILTFDVRQKAAMGDFNYTINRLT